MSQNAYLEGEARADKAARRAAMGLETSANSFADNFSTWPITMGAPGYASMGGPAATQIPPFAVSDGRPVRYLSEKERFLFDTQGWICIPGLLSEAECDAMREHCYVLQQEGLQYNAAKAGSYPARGSYSGPLEALTDHPAIVGFAQEYLAHPYMASESSYGFRMEMSFLTIRAATDDPQTPFSPHNGSGAWRLPGVGHSYSSLPGKAHA
eukprot:COSAG05_NODE_5993_length_1043_cov_1.454449_1_plen_209_part_10